MSEEWNHPIIPGESWAPEDWQLTVEDLLWLGFLLVCSRRSTFLTACEKRASGCQMGGNAEAVKHLARMPETVPKAAVLNGSDVLGCRGLT